MTNASGVTRLFINDQETVQYGRTFLHIICSACPMTTMTFFTLTVFQATGQKRQPILLSMLRKGTVDVPFMCLFSHIFGGGLMLGAWFMATDYVTSPITPKGQFVYGIILGVLTGLFRLFGGSAEGVSYAIIISNLLVPLIERVTLPKPFGKGGEK